MIAPRSIVVSATQDELVAHDRLPAAPKRLIGIRGFGKPQKGIRLWLLWQYRLLLLANPASTNLESYSHRVAYLKVLCFSNTRFDGHNVAVIQSNDSVSANCHYSRYNSTASS